MTEVRLAVIGAGRVFERMYVPALRSIVNARVVGVADPRGTDFGATTFATAQQLLAECPVDAIVVLSPPALHGEHVLAAVRRGLPVLVEKPPALHAADVEAWCEAGGAPLVTAAFSRRGWPAYRALRGQLGPGESADVVLRTNPASWGARDGIGEVAEDLLPHCIDLARWIGSVEVQAVRAARTERGLSGSLLLEGARTVRFETEYGSGYEERVLIGGRAIDLRPPGPLMEALRRFRGAPTREIAGVRLTLRAWLLRLGGRRMSWLPTAADAWACAATLDACRSSDLADSAVVDLPARPAAVPASHA